MKSVFTILLLSVVPGLLACSSTEPTGVAKEKTFTIATRQLPPEKPYSMTRWVRPPQVLPPRTAPVRASSSYISPVVHYKVKDISLKEAALVLAATTRYRSYCSSLISDQRLTLDSLGTLDELAEEIETLAGIDVIIDHDNKEVKFLVREAKTT
jgi:hypothetical protein